MKQEDLDVYVCPISHKPLVLKSIEEASGEILSGVLVSEEGIEFPIRDGIPDLTYPLQLADEDALARIFYDSRPGAYDENLHLTYKTHGEDEQSLRNKFVDALEIQPSFRVLEIACGTGRDSEIIAERLGSSGQLCLQDISPGMLKRCVQRMEGSSVSSAVSISNACYLPYPNRYFDAVYSFGGIGEFSDIRRGRA